MSAYDAAIASVATANPATEASNYHVAVPAVTNAGGYGNAYESNVTTAPVSAPATTAVTAAITYGSAYGASVNGTEHNAESAYSAYSSSTATTVPPSLPSSPPTLVSSPSSIAAAAAAAAAYAYAPEQQRIARAMRREWEDTQLFPLVTAHLQEAARCITTSTTSTTVSTAATATVNAATTATVNTAATGIATAAVSPRKRLPASYAWRSLRFRYLESLPTIDWNSLYQCVFESVAVSEEEKRRKREVQMRMLKRFEEFVRNTVELIAEEAHLPTASAASATDASSSDSDEPPHLYTKFLPPLSVGGLAGGEKYMYKNVLFKFARDWSGLFCGRMSRISAAAGVGGGEEEEAAEAEKDKAESDELVQKGAMAELKNMTALLQNDGDILATVPVFLTLTAAVRIRAHVVLATAIAPIEGRRTLVVGSADAGATIHTGESDADAAYTSALLAQRWNLRPHPVRDSAGKIHTLHLAADAEMHRSSLDGRLYLLDLSRLLPPTPPQKGTFEHLAFFFRPEYVRRRLLPPLPVSAESNAVQTTEQQLPPPLLASLSSTAPTAAPLSADVFSGFGCLSATEDQQAVWRNMRHLLYRALPVAAEALQNEWTNISVHDSVQIAAASRHIVSTLHAQGLNMRYIGILRSYLPCTAAAAVTDTALSLRQFLLLLMVARSLKQVYRAWVRRAMLMVGRKDSQQQQQQQHGWTEHDLAAWVRRWQRSQSPLQEDDAIDNEEAEAVPATVHHESSLLLALLLYLLFDSSATSSSSSFAAAHSARAQSFFSSIVFPSLWNKYDRLCAVLQFGKDDEICKLREDERCRGAMSPDVEIMSSPTVTQQEKQWIQQVCAELMHPVYASDTSNSTASAPAEVLVHLLFTELNVDFAALKQTLQQLKITVGCCGCRDQHSSDEWTEVSSTRELVYGLQRCNLADTAASSLSPALAALLYSLPLPTTVRIVPPLSSPSLAAAEKQLLRSLEARKKALRLRQSVATAVTASDADPPELLPTLLALLRVYEVDSNDSGSPQQQQQQQQQRQVPASERYEKGCAVIRRIDAVFSALSAASSAVGQRITYAPIIAFYRRFNRLPEAIAAAEKDVQVKRRAADAAAANISSASIEPLRQLCSAYSTLAALQLQSQCFAAAKATLQQEAASAKQLCIAAGEKDDWCGFGIVLATADEQCGCDESDHAFSSVSDADDINSLLLPTVESVYASSARLNLLLSFASACAHTDGSNSGSRRRALEEAVTVARCMRAKVTDEGEDGTSESDATQAERRHRPHPALVTTMHSLASSLLSSTSAAATAQTSRTSNTDDVQHARMLLENCVRLLRADAGLQPSFPLNEADATADMVTATTPADEPESLAPVYSSLATCYQRLNQPLLRVAALRRCVRINQRRFAAPNATGADNLGMLAAAWIDVANTDAQPSRNTPSSSSHDFKTTALKQAELCYQQALAHYSRLHGPTSNEVAATLSHLSLVHNQRGDLKAEYACLSEAMRGFLVAAQKKLAAAVVPSPSLSSTSTSTSASPPSTSTALSPPPTTLATLLSSNPHFLLTQHRFTSVKQRMSAAESRALAAGLCTYTVTGSNRTSQVWWRCLTCTPESPSASASAAAALGMCESCAHRCHASHTLVQQPATLFYCDCGAGEFNAHRCVAIYAKESAE